MNDALGYLRPWAPQISLWRDRLFRHLYPPDNTLVLFLPPSIDPEVNAALDGAMFLGLPIHLVDIDSPCIGVRT